MMAHSCASVKETKMQKNGVRYSASDVRPMFVGPVECGESVSAGVPGLGQLIPGRGTTTTNPPNTCSDSIFRKLMNGRDHSNWAQAVKCHSDARLARVGKAAAIQTIIRAHMNRSFPG